MSVPQSSIIDQALDLLDGLHGLIDVAFAHDLAVSFADVGSHDSVSSVTHAMIQLLASIHEDLPEVDGLGRLGALLGTLEPFAGALHEQLLDAGHLLGTRAVFAVLRTKRPVQLAFAHLRTAARLGSTQPVDAEQRASIRLAVEALVGNLGSFAELLRALDPLPSDLVVPPALLGE